MRVQDIMSRGVETVKPGDSAVLANELMWRHEIHHLVVMEGDEVIGIVSDTDLGGPEAEAIPDNQQVKDIMSTDVVLAEPTMTVDRAGNIFRERRIHCLPVMEEGKLVGIVTSTDLETLAKRGSSNPPPRTWAQSPRPENIPGGLADKSPLR